MEHLQGRILSSSSANTPEHRATPPAECRSATLLLTQVMHSITDRLEPLMDQVIERLARQLFALAETGRGTEQHIALDALRHLNRRRADLLPELLRSLQLAAEAAHAPAATAAPPRDAPSDAWRLLDNTVVEETALVDTLAAYLETRLHLPLHLLGERLGVLFERDAPEARALPFGPHALLLALRDASVAVDMAFEARSMLLQQFAGELKSLLPACYDLANARLRAAGLLPDLTGYRPKARLTVAHSAAGAPTAPHPAVHTPDGDAAACDDSRNLRPFAAWLDLANADANPAPDAEQTIFDVMRHLLGGRRAFLGRGAPSAPSVPTHPVATAQVQALLRELQHAPVGDAVAERGMSALKPALLQRLQACVPDGSVPCLGAAQTDTVELVDMLFEHLLHGVPPHCAGAGLLARLQVPLLRVALQDTGFFTRKHHPARRMLDTLADAGLFWLDDARDGDAGFAQALTALVDEVAAGFDGELDVFESAANRLQRQLAERVRRAALIERRHIAAEQGRERLALARADAAAAIASAIGARPLPTMLQALLAGAWTDALALAAVRDGATGVQFARRAAAAATLVKRATASPVDAATQVDADNLSGVRDVLVDGLRQVGHADAAASALAADAIACAVAGSASTCHDGGIDAATGDDSGTADIASTCAASSIVTPMRAAPAIDTADPVLDAAARSHLERLRRLPFGTWFDLDTDTAARCRCRMSWFSPVTGRCLFVNARGQRVVDRTLVWLAQEMAAGRAELMREAQSSVVDVAWQTILGMLRSITGAPAPASA